MPETRDKLCSQAKLDVSIARGTHKEAVLALLAATPDTGYTPKEIAAQTPVPKDSVYPVVRRLHDDGLIEKLSDHYLVAQDYVEAVRDMVLTSQQLGVADDISDRNTAPETVDAPDPEDLDAPKDDLIE